MEACLLRESDIGGRRIRRKSNYEILKVIW
jgi:hypothetical protein